jgi:tetratricopeptide (TPR) repeat protein
MAREFLTETASDNNMNQSPTQPTLVRGGKVVAPFLTNVLSSPLPSDDEHDNRELSYELASTPPQTNRDPPSPADKKELSSCQASSSDWLCGGVLFPVVESSEGDTGGDWCNLPFGGSSPTAAKVRMDDHRSLGGIEDGESISSLSTFGGNRVFGDLDSIPSVNTTTIPLANKQMEQEIDDGSTIASLGNLSALEVPGDDDTIESGAMLGDAESIGTNATMNSAKVDAAVEKKLKQIASIDDLVANPSMMSEATKTSKRAWRQNGKSAHAEAACDSESNVASAKSRRQALVRELRLSIDRYGRYDIRCANVTAALGEVFDELFEFNQALKLQKEVVSIYSTKLGDHHVTTINSKVQLGKLQEKTGDIDTAIETYYNVLSMQKTINGEKDSSVPDALTFISKALKSKGRAEQAIKELKRALKMYRQSLGDAHPRVTSTVDEISALYIIVGDFAKAAAILEEVVKLKAATMGVNNCDVAQTLLQLATAYECSGDNLQAMKSLKKAYSVYANVQGDNSEEATSALKRIAVNYKISGDSERAVAAFLGVLRGRKTSMGEAHPLVAQTYLELGIALRENSQPDKALKCMRQALSVYVGEGKDMHDVGMIAEVMREMGLTHKSKGQLNEAIKILKQELAIRQKIGEREKPNIAKTLQHLGGAELELRNHTQSLNYFMEALGIYQDIDGELSIEFAETLYGTGLVFEATRHRDRAKEAFLEALEIFRSQDSDTSIAQASLLTKKLKQLGHNFNEENDKCS